MENRFTNLFRGYITSIKSGEDISPSFTWYVLLWLFVVTSLIGMVIAYDRYRWAMEAVQVEHVDVQENSVSQEDIAQVVRVYENRKEEHERLRRGGVLDVPWLYFGETTGSTGQTPPSSSSRDVESPIAPDATSIPEFY